MSSNLPESGQATALALVGLAVLAVPAGLALAQGMTASYAATDKATDAVVTPTLPPVYLTPTPTPTTTDSDESPQGNASTLVVDADVSAGGVAADAECPNAEHHRIQDAVDEASQGNTVVVCAGQYNSVEIETANLTLRAHGDAEITSTGQPAVRTNAPRVTIRGFTVSAEQSEYMILVGGRATHIQNNTVEVPHSNTTGIFLSDGLTPESGDPDTALGAATGSRVLNNTINIPDQPGDQEDPTQSGDGELQVGVFTDADQTVARDNTIIMDDDYARAIHSTGNWTTIRRNSIQYPTPCPDSVTTQTNCDQNNYPAAILLGKEQVGGGYNLCAHGTATGKFDGHEWARQNHVIDNTVDDPGGEVLYIGTSGNHTPVTEGLVVRGNRFKSGGIGGWVNTGLFKNNTITTETIHHGDATEDADNPRLCVHFTDSRLIGNRIDIGLFVNGHNITIKGNTITKGGILINDPWYKDDHPTSNVRIIKNMINDTSGGFNAQQKSSITITTGANVTEIAHNRITGSTKNGVSVGDPEGCGTGGPCPITVSSFHHNTITGHDSSGVVIAKAATVKNFHHNRIYNNQRLGIHKLNYDKSDGEWPIVNATHNYWGCGGPSGGLEDAETGRVANGTGDQISAGDDTGVSNIHFDPFFVRPGVSCPAGLSNPTPEPSPTPSPTPTPTSTPTQTPPPTPTPTPTPAAGSGNGTGGTGGNGTGGTGDTGSGETGSTGGPSESQTGGTTTATPPPTATPTQTPPTPTISPTPVVEPGFGVLAWLGGAALLAGLVALRRRVPSESEEDA